MRHYIKLIVATIALLGQGCSTTDKQFEGLLNDPEKFQGKKIELEGIFHHQFEDVAIYLTGNSDTEKALWVNYSDEFVSLADRLDGQRVKVSGVFNKDEKGHLGQYAGSLNEATLKEE